MTTATRTPSANGKRTVAAEYDYRDEAGDLLYQVVRYEPKAFRQRRPDGCGGWKWNLEGIRRVLYRLPELLAFPYKSVFVVEGEKDADNLWRIEVVGTTCAQGAGKWKSEYSESLRDRAVIIIPDNDDIGRKHAEQVAESLHGVAHSVAILELPDLPPKGDVSDWIAVLGNDKVQLLELASKAPAWHPREGDRRSGNRKNQKPVEEGKQKKDSAATRLIGYAGASLALFHNQEGEGYATTRATPSRTFPLRSRTCRQYLAKLFFEAEAAGASGETVQTAINTLEGMANASDMHEVHVRLAAREGKIFLDLGNAHYQVVEIGPDGWRIADGCPVRFRRSRGMLPLPTPVRGGSITELRTFLNVGPDDNWRLMISWLLAALRPRGPYPVLCLHGEQGCAKSTAARVLRGLVDPNVAPLRTRPRDERDLMICANNSWVLALDNLSDLPDWLSDAFCRLATGGGFATRELFTDADEQIFNSQRPVILNGIPELATRGDLIERALILHLPSIPDDQRRTEASFWAALRDIEGRIFGALLDAVAVGLRNEQHVALARLPRMADFAVWVEACGPAAGWEPGEFLKSYAGNITDANELALDTSVVVPPLRRFLEQRGAWEGSPTDLHEELTKLADEKVAKSRDWPSKANVLSGCLKRLAPNLRRVGTIVEFDRGPVPKRQRVIRLEKDAHSSSTPSMSSTAAENPGTGVDDRDEAHRPVDDPPPAGTQGSHAVLDGMDGLDDVSAAFPGKGDSWEGD